MGQIKLPKWANFSCQKQRAELMSICKRQQSGVNRWEVKRISEAAEPALPVPSTMLENQLTRSIEEVKAQRALNDARRGRPDSLRAPCKLVCKLSTHLKLSLICAPWG